MTDRVELCYADEATGYCEACDAYCRMNRRTGARSCLGRQRSDREMFGDDLSEDLIDALDNMGDN